MKNTFRAFILLSLIGLCSGFTPKILNSWQEYVNGYLVNNTDATTGKTAENVCEHGAIVGNQDGTLWASTPGFTLVKYNATIENEDGTTQKAEIDEFANLFDAFNNNGSTSRMGGIRLNKEKYFVISFDSDRSVMYLKKSGGGACIAKSNLGFVIGTFSSKLKVTSYSGTQEPQNSALTNRACESLQTFLLENNM